jgi:hypothetical protein
MATSRPLYKWLTGQSIFKFLPPQLPLPPPKQSDWTDETNHEDSGPYDRSKTIAERAAWSWHLSFARMAGDAEKNCPVSKVLNAEITLDAKLL